MAIQTRIYKIDFSILYISIQVYLRTAQWFQKLENGNDDNPETIDR